MRKQEAIDLFRYTQWANARVFDAIAALDAEWWTREIGGSFGTIRDTVAHLISAEWVWLERWEGRSPGWPPSWVAEEGFPDLRTRSEAISAARLAWIEGLSDDDLGGLIEYGRLNGDRHRRHLDGLIRHVVNHSTYHRGQLVMMLRMAGAAAPSTDMVYWYPEAEA